MTTMEIDGSSKSGLKFILFLFLVLFALSVVIVNSNHADKHSSASSIRNCNNIIQIWLSGDCERFHLLKQLEDGKVGDHIIEPENGVGKEVTAFVPRNGILSKIEDWLIRQGAIRIYP